MQGTTIMLIGVVAVLVLVVLMALVVRIYREGDGLSGLFKVLPVFFVALMAVIVLAQITEEVTPYSYDATSGTLTITGNVYQDYSPWDDYANDVRSLVIEDGVGIISSGAFDTLTNLEYVSIGKGVSLGSGAFGVTLMDYLDQTVAKPSGEYVGTGDGTLYECNASIYTYNALGTITGVIDPSIKTMVVPAIHDGTLVTRIGINSMTNNTSIVRILHHPESELKSIGSSAFSGCTALSMAILPAATTSLEYRAFYGCAALSVLDAPGIEDYGQSAFQGCRALPLALTATAMNIGNSAFNGCTSITALHFPASISSIGSWAFADCTGIASVSFDSGFAPTTLDTSAFRSWTFYASDGTTTIDKTVAANLAGKTFQGTASALVEVLPDRSSLTPDQIQKVRLHDAELQDLKDQITLDPLPVQPSLKEELTA